MKKFLIVFFAFIHTAFAQFETAPEFFRQQDLNVTGRIRQLTVEQVFKNPQKEIVVMTRNGEFPNWKALLSIWAYSPSLRQMEKTVEFEMPRETIFYGFIQNADRDAYLILVLPQEIRIGKWNQQQWVFDPHLTASIRSLSQIPYASLAQPFDPMVGLQGQPNWFWIPTFEGYQIFAIEKEKLISKQLIPLKPKSFYHSSHDLLPFEFQYWFQNVYWFPKIEIGFAGLEKKPTFLSPWMDEMSMIEYSPSSMAEKIHYFNLLTENERDDGIHYIVNRPVDLNGDGRTDFLINKFMGTGTAFRAQNYYYMAKSDGTIPANGKAIKTDPKKASGALVVDLDHDQKQDFIIVSTSFTPWAMVRAIMKRQVLMEFDFHKYKTDQNPYNFNQPDLHQEVLFDFHLGDLFIDGVLPTLDGDFNGDGYPDVFYARNRESLSFLIQHPKDAAFFPSQPSGVFPFKVPRKYRLGDLDGDGKDEIVFFNTRENKNRQFIVLMNRGLLK